MTFRLEKQPPSKTSTRFPVVDSAGSICGIVTVANEAVSDLQKHWKGAPPQSLLKTANAAKRDPMIATMVAAVRKRGARVNKAAILRVAKLVKDEGVGGMVRTGAWLDTVVGTEVLSIGRAALAREDCLLELSGRQLFYKIALRGGWIWISACSMDEPDLPEFLFNLGDTPPGWTTVRRFVAALERSGIKSLKEPPIEIGQPGSPDSFVIG